MANIKGCFSHNSDDWSTPKVLYNYFIDHGFFDPCPLKSNVNCLELDIDKNMFINPPYSKISLFIHWALDMFSKHGKQIFLLIPSRTDTKYFQALMTFGCDFYFIKGRLHFNDLKAVAPFPSVLIRLSGCRSQIFALDLKDFYL